MSPPLGLSHSPRLGLLSSSPRLCPGVPTLKGYAQRIPHPHLQRIPRPRLLQTIPVERPPANISPRHLTEKACSPRSSHKVFWLVGMSEGTVVCLILRGCQFRTCGYSSVLAHSCVRVSMLCRTTITMVTPPPPAPAPPFSPPPPTPSPSPSPLALPPRPPPSPSPSQNMTRGGCPWSAQSLQCPYLAFEARLLLFFRFFDFSRSCGKPQH